MNNKLKLKKINIKRRLFKYRGLFKPLVLMKSLKQLKKIKKKSYNSNKSSDKYNIWGKSFKDLLKVYPEKIDLVESFHNSNIQLITKNKKEKEISSPIMICVVSNDLERTQLIYKHHSDIGINHFVFIDNNSKDGTLEWLEKQKNVDLYSVTEEFTSNKKYGWINKVLSIYGFNQWYLYVDSDEMFVYPDCEKISIDSYIAQLSEKNEDRVASLMVDMYSDNYIFSNDRYNILRDFIYFDTDSYTMEKNLKGISVKGGPRSRIIKDQEEVAPLLIKHPLFYFKEGEIFESAHYLFPFQYNLQIKSALLHYKFLPTDLEKYKIRAEKGNFSQGSREYKMYLKYLAETQIKFIYDGSEKYIDSNSLKLIDVVNQK